MYSMYSKLCLGSICYTSVPIQPTMCQIKSDRKLDVFDGKLTGSHSILEKKDANRGRFFFSFMEGITSQNYITL